MGSNKRTPEMQERLRRAAGGRAKAQDAARRIEEWNARVAAGEPSSPTLGDALLSGHHWLDVACDGCRTSRSVDLRRVDHHRDASIESLIPALRCSWCGGNAPMARLRGLCQSPAAVGGVRDSA
jgi:hypothetical protein